MVERGEQGPLMPVEGDDGEWAHWWQGYWSDAPEAREGSGVPEPHTFWRESAHEFDFGGGEE